MNCIQHQLCVFPVWVDGRNYSDLALKEQTKPLGYLPSLDSAEPEVGMGHVFAGRGCRAPAVSRA